MSVNKSPTKLKMFDNIGNISSFIDLKALFKPLNIFLTTLSKSLPNLSKFKLNA